MNRLNSLFVAIVLIASLPCLGVATSGPQFVKWKSRLKEQKLFPSYSTPYGYRESTKAFAEAIRSGNISALIQFLNDTSYERLETALGHSYFLEMGPQIPRSALQLALIFGQDEAAKVLLDFATAHPDKANLILELDEAGQSPLHMAIYLNEPTIVAELLKFERHHPCCSQLIFAKNGKGELPLDAAQRYGRLEILELLRMPPPQEPASPIVMSEAAGQETEIITSRANLYVVPAMISVAVIYLLFTKTSTEK